MKNPLRFHAFSVVLSLLLLPGVQGSAQPTLLDLGPPILATPDTVRDPLGFRIDALERLPNGSIGAVMREIGDRVSLYFSFSFDGGDTWQTPRLIDPLSPDYSSVEIFGDSPIYFGISNYIIVIYNYEYQGTQGSRAAYTYNGNEWFTFDSIFFDCGNCRERELRNVQLVSPTMLVVTEKSISLGLFPNLETTSFRFSFVDIAERRVTPAGSASAALPNENPVVVPLSGLVAEYLTVAQGDPGLITGQGDQPGAFFSGNGLLIEGGDFSGDLRHYAAGYNEPDELFGVSYITIETDGPTSGSYRIGYSARARDDSSWSPPRTLIDYPADDLASSGMPSDVKIAIGDRSRTIAWVDFDAAQNRFRFNMLSSFDGGANWGRQFRGDWAEINPDPSTWQFSFSSRSYLADMFNDSYSLEMRGVNPLGTRDLLFFNGIGYGFSERTTPDNLQGVLTY